MELKNLCSTIISFIEHLHFPIMPDYNNVIIQCGGKNMRLFVYENCIEMIEKNSNARKVTQFSDMNISENNLIEVFALIDEYQLSNGISAEKYMQKLEFTDQWISSLFKN